MITRAAIFAALVLAAAGTAAQAEPNEDLHELQERCGKEAAALFQRLDDRDPPPVWFASHYNPDLNGCFALLNRTRPETSTTKLWVDWELWDVNENWPIDVMGFEPAPGEKAEHLAGTPEPTLQACLSGNFIRCGDRGEYAQGFARSVLTYMQRLDLKAPLPDYRDQGPHTGV